jgi:hypothetical protein
MLYATLNDKHLIENTFNVSICIIIENPNPPMDVIYTAKFFFFFFAPTNKPRFMPTCTNRKSLFIIAHIECVEDTTIKTVAFLNCLPHN